MSFRRLVDDPDHIIYLLENNIPEVIQELKNNQHPSVREQGEELRKDYNNYLQNWRDQTKWSAVEWKVDQLTKWMEREKRKKV